MLPSGTARLHVALSGLPHPYRCDARPGRVRSAYDPRSKHTEETHLSFAYIDPGAGSLLIQALIAGAVSVPFIFRNAIRSALGKFRRDPRQADPVNGPPAEE